MNTKEQAIGTSRRKPYNNRAGYIASLRSGSGCGFVVIYRAEAQGIDPAGGPYAIVCETHATIAKATSLPKARGIMKAADFCEECMAERAVARARMDAIVGRDKQ